MAGYWMVIDGQLCRQAGSSDLETLDLKEAFTDGNFMDRTLREWPWASEFPSQLLD